MSIAKINSYKLIILGMNGEFSKIPFQILLEAGANILAVVMARESADNLGPKWLPNFKQKDSELNILGNPVRQTLKTVAMENQVPIMTVGDMKDEKTYSEIAKLKPDLILTICFPRVLPRKWLSLPKLACLNLHPSLLPSCRGPAPLFWQFRAGEKNTGVSLHHMEEKLDTGDIVAQRKVSFPEGISSIEADRQTAKVGGALILDAMSQSKFVGRPQDAGTASYHPMPNEKARTISVNWSVLHAYNFLRGADEWAPFWIELEDGKKLQINQVIDYKVDKKQPHLVLIQDGVNSVMLKDGLLIFS